MGRNLHHYYFKEYFGEKQEEIIDPEDRQNRRKINARLDWMNIKTNKANPRILKKRNACLTEGDLLYVIEKPVETNDVFSLEIIYPGLVTGIGINHEATIEGEFKLGLHFDWTWGMPVVYGSSVKGVLRSSFIAKVEKGKIVEYDDYYLKKKIPDYDWDQQSIRLLFNAIFEGKSPENTSIPIYKRDVFFDAVITKADKKGRILCSDSITPHGDNPLKNPVPITFLKIAPGCQLEFRFKLVPTEIEKEGKVLTLSPEDKLSLFKEILTTVGIGAKTNVGYGQLKASDGK